MLHIYKKANMISSGKLLDDYKGKIIYYHNIREKTQIDSNQITDINLFKNHIEFLIEQGFEIVKSIPTKRYQVAINFDDGFEGIYNFCHYLIEKGIFITNFLIPANINKQGYLDRQQILYLQSTGFFRFGSHTYNHVNLPYLDHREIYHELLSSKKYLEELLQYPVDDFCFPRGLFSRKCIELAFQAGYKNLYSSVPGPSGKLVSGSLIRRNLVQNANIDEFKRIMQKDRRLYSWYIRTKHQKK